MQRTKLIDRNLPDYTRGEEIFNMVSHIVGGGIGVAVCALCYKILFKRRPLSGGRLLYLRFFNDTALHYVKHLPRIKTRNSEKGVTDN